MSLSPITGSSSLLGATYSSASSSASQERRQLSQSLQNGDLAGAQSAFAALTQSLSRGSQRTSAKPSSIIASLGDPNSPISQDFEALGQALQNGDLAGARQDFAKLQQDLKAQFGTPGSVNAAQHRHTHHAAQSAASDADGDGDGDTTDAPNSTEGSYSPPPTPQVGTTINVVG